MIEASLGRVVSGLSQAGQPPKGARVQQRCEGYTCAIWIGENPYV